MVFPAHHNATGVDYLLIFKKIPLYRADTKIHSEIWAKVLAKAKIENFRWHDLRHTWASWLIQRGVPLAALQEMGGWETPSMVQRYAHLAPEHLHKHSALLNDCLL